MKNRHRQKGVSLIELMAGAAIVGGLVYFASSSFSTATHLTKTFNSASENEVSLTAAFTTILETGRLAQNCSKSGSDLACQLNFNSPPTTGANTNVRFRLSAGTLFYEAQNGATWTVRAHYPDITGFTVCNDADMIGGLCPILPLNMSNDRKFDLAAVPPSLPNRFFRFELKQKISSSTSLLKEITLPGSFFVRNPMTGIAGGVAVYQWGNKK